MPFKINDEYVQNLFTKHLRATETDLIYGFGFNMGPLWSHAFLGALTVFFMKFYFLGLTQERLLVLEVDMMYKEKRLLPIEFVQIDEIKIKNLFLGLRVFIIRLVNGKKFSLTMSPKPIGLKNAKDHLERMCQIFYARNLRRS